MNHEHYYVEPKAPSDAGSDSKKRLRSLARLVIRSAVHKSQITTTAKRTSQAGRGEDLWPALTLSNDFRLLQLVNALNCTPIISRSYSPSANEAILYQFDVNVKILVRDGSWRPCRKGERLEVQKTIIEREHFPLLWYDEGKNLYSTENLTLNYKKEYQCDIVHKKTERTNKFRFLLIKLVKTYELKSIFDFMQKRIDVRPHGSVRILETLFKQT